MNAILFSDFNKNDVIPVQIIESLREEDIKAFHMAYIK